MNRVDYIKDFDLFKDKISLCIKRLYDNDIELFSYNTVDRLICERTLTFRLGYYLQDVFIDYNVDCEYNRYLDNIKQIKGNNIYPDIVIHKRMTNDSNLAWIEIKKKSNLVYANNDRERLKFATRADSKFHYKYGVFIILDESFGKTLIEYYINGKKIFLSSCKEYL